MADPELVVTGLGLVTTFGCGVQPFWTRLVEGASGLTAAAVAPAPGPSDRPDDPGRQPWLVRRALDEALADAGLPAPPARAVVVLVGQTPALDRTTGRRLSMLGADPLATAVRGDAEPVFLSHACASVLFGIALGGHWLRAGLADTAIVLGGWTAGEYGVASMEVVKALSPEVARPFDAERTGTTLGEGGGALVLERATDANRRGATPRAVVAGVTCRVAGTEAAASDPGATSAVLTEALRRTGVRCPDHVHAHAAGTRQGDEAELAGLDRLARDQAWPATTVSSHKGAVGHLMHSAGFPASVAAVRTLETRTAPPTAGLRAPVERGGLTVPTTAQRLSRVDSVLVNSFGFGGNTAAMVLRKP
ncbi:3-oxoacyl-[acyl-carrier-protein] synthase 2 [Actinoplanes ianthinogenes]|uniref:3-oxoacyl-[acyl-carrier-protein] synthase 2 n=1 Tax=Actinoplanes ianthinogenes TaxID=122358 RepID=A0ABM7LKC7_9ACTN|nr:beta-ketoacyl synthase N-terminal-like domain-containing protein [Actinoplanes ianthinogenes]BCJ39695.1 3-oxoacyl-[acyl-carrier-protein] synthase 2 [Actinoplanes ianthinogenes]GGR48067.1 3-oxoacyl-[acyl-carrier-protein] synthase 2 [Actinoplanes ianthinogenes]